MFVKFSNIDVKVVLDRQPLFGTGPLAGWLHNLARGRAGPREALDTFNDNLCLWHCITVHRRAGLPHRSTQATRELANIFYKLKTTPRDWAKTSLDELDKVERHFNQRKLVLEWFGIRVLAPECEEDGEVIWHLRKNMPEVLLTVGIYDGHVFLIKDINRLARTYLCNDCQAHYKNRIS